MSEPAATIATNIYGVIAVGITSVCALAGAIFQVMKPKSGPIPAHVTPEVAEVAQSLSETIKLAFEVSGKLQVWSEATQKDRDSLLLLLQDVAVLKDWRADARQIDMAHSRQLSSLDAKVGNLQREVSSALGSFNNTMREIIDRIDKISQPAEVIVRTPIATAVKTTVKSDSAP